ncbi:MAG: mechanosensitive ion channel family protein [Verrucomicrobiaceae bacterium]|nr:MAG: mechanosensitive ion channel family protein [Verrucomicrobiaceae bacterium]
MIERLLDHDSTRWLLTDTGGAPLWAWLALPVLVMLVWMAARMAGWLAKRVLLRGDKTTGWRNGLAAALVSPLAMLLGVWLFRMGRTLLPLNGQANAFIGYLELAAGTVAGTWMFLRLARLICDRLSIYLDHAGKPHAKAVVPLLRKVLLCVVFLLGFIFLLQNMNVNVGAMLAGLGIGGLALALAGQKTVENLFGGVSLVMDQPARVGDACNFGGSSGTIEDIGLRSTRVRTADRTIVTIPNSKLAEMQIENVSARDRILLKATIGLKYETTPVQFRAVLDAVRELLGHHQDIAPAPRVRFVAFTQTSLDIEIFSYVATGDYNRFLEVREEIYLKLMDIVNEKGAGFASPSPTVVVNQDGRIGPDTKAPEEVEASDKS